MSIETINGTNDYSTFQRLIYHLRSQYIFIFYFKHILQVLHQRPIIYREETIYVYLKLWWISNLKMIILHIKSCTLLLSTTTPLNVHQSFLDLSLTNHKVHISNTLWSKTSTKYYTTDETFITIHLTKMRKAQRANYAKRNCRDDSP